MYTRTIFIKLLVWVNIHYMCLNTMLIFTQICPTMLHSHVIEIRAIESTHIYLDIRTTYVLVSCENLSNKLNKVSTHAYAKYERMVWQIVQYIWLLYFAFEWQAMGSVHALAQIAVASRMWWFALWDSSQIMWEKYGLGQTGKWAEEFHLDAILMNFAHGMSQYKYWTLAFAHIIILAWANLLMFCFGLLCFISAGAAWKLLCRSWTCTRGVRKVPN